MNFSKCKKKAEACVKVDVFLGLEEWLGESKENEDFFSQF